MKKIAIIFGLAIALVACHTKKPQNESGINDPINVTYNDVDTSVLTKPSGQPQIAKKPASQMHSAADTSATSSASCIDSTKMDKGVMCTQDYKPVCGCDQKTYSNECMAKKAGVTKWTEGECAGDKGKTKSTSGKEKSTSPKKKKK